MLSFSCILFLQALLKADVVLCSYFFEEHVLTQAIPLKGWHVSV